MTLGSLSRKQVAGVVAGCVLASSVYSSSQGFVVDGHVQKSGLSKASPGFRHRVASVDKPGPQAAHVRKGTVNSILRKGAVASSVSAVLFVKSGFGSRMRSCMKCSMAKPLLQSSPDWQEGMNGVYVTIMRIIAASLIFHHGMEHAEDGSWIPGSNEESVTAFAEFMLRPYFSWLPFFDMYFYALCRDYSEVLGSIALFIGFGTRFAGAALTGTMIAACYYHIAADGLRAYSFEEPALFLMMYAFFMINGGGPYSIDALISKNMND